MKYLINFFTALGQDVFAITILLVMIMGPKTEEGYI